MEKAWLDELLLYPYYIIIFFFSLLDDIVFSIKLVNHLIKLNTTQLMYYFIFLPILFIYKKIDVIS